MDKLYIIIPAYNEEANIEMVAREWHEVVAGISQDSRLVIINDGSKDQTYEKLCALQEELPQLLPVTKENGGHGATVLYGYFYALEYGADYIFQTDSDGQTLASEFQGFWEQRDEKKILIGYRNHREDGISRIFVTKVLKIVLFFIFGIRVTDANTPYRLMPKELLQKYIVKVPENFNLSNVMLTVLFLRGKENVQFIPITFRPRQGGVNSINLKKITKIGIQAVKDFRTIKKNL
ncbi:glycosyltransferase family 2 protein [Roseburia inulinivorans]|jgi:dolichol-phosphate mannosyltransferase|uniref:Glycosyltransferase family 2 protein n=1 Tax=Roseburia inulinivorans TaxID=360807 RepID=A0A3R5Y300_9FIRM|nr:glycosyltransferase family 2 protein [Roseburia inulinivorans]RGQ48167.1 glycosyltransferase family 2 protein [Roseburia inulinivorans]